MNHVNEFDKDGDVHAARNDAEVDQVYWNDQVVKVDLVDSVIAINELHGVDEVDELSEGDDFD